MALSYPVSIVLISIFISLLFIRCLCDCFCYKLNDEPSYNDRRLLTKAPKKSSKPASNKSEYIAIV